MKFYWNIFIFYHLSKIKSLNNETHLEAYNSISQASWKQIFVSTNIKYLWRNFLGKRFPFNVESAFLMSCAIGKCLCLRRSRTLIKLCFLKLLQIFFFLHVDSTLSAIHILFKKMQKTNSRVEMLFRLQSGINGSCDSLLITFSKPNKFLTIDRHSWWLFNNFSSSNF